MLTRRHVLAASAAGFAAASVLPRAFAQAVQKPVRVIVGFPAGGGTDVIARILAERLRGPYAAAVLVENKPGAAARVAVEYVKNAEPDGSTMLFTPDFPITVYPASFRSLNYDPLKDFTPVSPAARSMLTYNVGPGVPDSVKTLADFVQWCKANPGKAIYATTAAGGTPHFVGMMLANAAGVAMNPVHYRGGAPALQDLIGGHVPAAVNPISESMAQAKAGTIRILAVTGSQRSSFLPDVPTMREAGYDVVVESWLGVFVPARTPAETVNALSATIADAVKSAPMIDSLAKVGNTPAFQSPADFAATVKADIARWAPVVKASGFVAED
ncbi:MAG TPA: tripartite tricarboxylate transporter substrate-binding protein [Xanthobacteraceae bacterium]|nr:tripartite tricarboxylate transporter substrate-binding protein [Xanthobacteraceae bacterium]